MESEWTNELLERIEVTERVAPPGGGGVRVGRLAVADPAHGVAVTFPEQVAAEPVPARSTVIVSAQDAGRHVVLLFEEGDAARPIIVGIVQDHPVQVRRDVMIDGKRVCLEAEDELTLKSGKASITLQVDGRIVIKGMEIVSRARGTHKVKGATVLIN